MTPMETLADEIRQAQDIVNSHEAIGETAREHARYYLNGLLMAEAILKGEID